jgi:hypothetical protein
MTPAAGGCIRRVIRRAQDAKSKADARSLLTQHSARQMELIENSLLDQRLAMKVRSRLRVICATPF